MNRSADPYDPHECARRGDATSLQWVLQSRPNAANLKQQATNITPLHNAVDGQHLDCVDLLLRYRAAVDAADSNLRTPLHCAAKHSDADIAVKLAQRLLAQGANPTLRMNTGETVLHLAAREGNVALLKLIVDNATERDINYDIDCITKKDETPLFLAASGQHKEAVLYLLQRNANPKMPNRHGRTPLHMALRWAKSDVKKPIEQKAREMPDVKFRTLPSGVCMRDDLVPKCFLDVYEELTASGHRAKERPDAAAPRAREGERAASAPAGITQDTDCSFWAQLKAMGGDEAEKRRLEGRGPAPERPALSRKGSQMSIHSSRGATSDTGSRETSQVRSTAATSTAATEQARRKEKTSRVKKERDRVDDRLRGLFYADLTATRQRQRLERHRSAGEGAEQGTPGAAPRHRGGGPDDSQTRLAVEVRSLKEAGFKDPSKEERKMWRKQCRAQRKLLREQRESRERAKEAGGDDEGSDNEDNVGELCRKLLGPDGHIPPELQVVPYGEGFTLRKIACPGDAGGPSSGIFAMVDSLEQRLQQIQTSQSDISRLCADMREHQQALRADLKRSKRARSQPPPSTAASPAGSPGRGGAGPGAGRGAGFADSAAGLPRREQLVLERVDARLAVLEKRAQRRKRRVAEAEAARREAAVTFWWAMRVAVFGAAASMLWLHGAFSQLLPPPLWV